MFWVELSEVYMERTTKKLRTFKLFVLLKSVLYFQFSVAYSGANKMADVI